MNSDENDTPDGSGQTQVEFKDLKRVAKFFAWLIGLGLGAAVAFALSVSGRYSWGVLMWAWALLASGAGLGFLFGIPKVLQRDAAATPAAAPEGAAGVAPSTSRSTYRQRVNTNLEEISDWLTKIIVGVSLIQLKTAPEHLSRLADLIAASLGTNVPRGFGVALVLFFATSGFLFGYLVTRLYIQGALARAERGLDEEGAIGERILRARAAKANQAVERELEAIGTPRESAQAGPTLSIPPELAKLADTYLKVEAKDWKERVETKNRLAAEMAAIVIRQNVSRDLLAEQTHEGLLVALAAAVQHSPQPDDTRRLLAAAAHATRLHVQYLFVMAFHRLLEAGYVSEKDKAAILQVLDRFESRADESLRLAIAGLRRKLEAARRAG